MKTIQPVKINYLNPLKTDNKKHLIMANIKSDNVSFSGLNNAALKNQNIKAAYNLGLELYNNPKVELEEKLENILSTIKNVGKVNVFINYSESSSSIPLYDESTTTSTTTEGDSDGGTRNTIETENQKEVVFTEKSGIKDPVIQKTVMPVIEGAIITAEGANNAEVKTNIINAVQAVTGLTIDRVQVFEMKIVKESE